MIARVFPGKISGSIPAIPSKAHAHRLLICAALADGVTEIDCPGTSEDILATARCMGALGAQVSRTEAGFTVSPGRCSDGASLDCGESGSTYRFVLPVACALGANARFLLGGRLPERPMEALFSALGAHGIMIGGKGTAEVTVRGTLTGGQFLLPGDVSSQFISGLIMASPMTGADCEIVLTSPLESRGYVDITLAAVRQFGVLAEFDGTRVRIPGGQRYVSPGRVVVEGDWSNAAFFLCAGRGEVRVLGLDPSSPQGDREIEKILARFGTPPKGINVDVSDIPDLAPAIALIGISADGVTRMTNAGRLRLKESDRVASIVGTLAALGADCREDGDAIVVCGGARLRGGRVDSFMDHRIAMMAACAAVFSDSPIEIERAEAVNKSYPGFFDDLRALGLTVVTEVD